MLPRAVQVRLVVHFDPVDASDRRGAHFAAAVDELLEPVLVVKGRVAAPRRLERVGQRLGRLRAEVCHPDVLAVGRFELLADPENPGVPVQRDLHRLRTRARTSSTARMTPPERAARSVPSTLGGWTVSPFRRSAPSAKASRASQSEWALFHSSALSL